MPDEMVDKMPLPDLTERNESFLATDSICGDRTDCRSKLVSAFILSTA